MPAFRACEIHQVDSMEDISCWVELNTVKINASILSFGSQTPSCCLCSNGCCWGNSGTGLEKLMCVHLLWWSKWFTGNLWKSCVQRKRLRLRPVVGPQSVDDVTSFNTVNTVIHFFLSCHAHVTYVISGGWYGGGVNVKPLLRRHFQPCLCWRDKRVGYLKPKHDPFFINTFTT